MKHRAAVALVALTLVLSFRLQAQGDEPSPGARVRVWPSCPAPEALKSRSCAPVIGRLLSIDTARVLIARTGMSADTLPVGSVSRVEVSAGSRHHTLLGLGAGAVVGFGAGMILAGRAGCGNGIFGSPGGEDDDICGAYGVVAIPAGAALGAVVGRLIRSERWRPVAASGANLRVVPSRERLGLSMTLPF